MGIASCDMASSLHARVTALQEGEGQAEHPGGGPQGGVSGKLRFRQGGVVRGPGGRTQMGSRVCVSDTRGGGEDTKLWGTKM